MEQAKGVFFIRPEGKTIPDKTIEMALLKYDRWFSATIAEVIDGQPKLTTMTIDLKKSTHKNGAFGEVKDLLADVPDSKVLCHFSLEEIDPQPFTIIDGEVVVCVDGNFDDEVESVEGHTTNHTFANDYLSTKVVDLYERAEGDIPKLVQALQSPNISKEMGKMGSGPHMAMAIMCNNGQIPVFHRPKEELLKYDWGMASNDVMEEVKGEVKAVATLASEPAKLNAIPLWKQKADAKKAAIETSKGGVKSPVVADSKVAATATATSVPVAGAKTDDLDLRVVKIPEIFQELKTRRKWFVHRTVGGEPPVGFEKMQGVYLVPMDLLQKVENKKTLGELTHKYPKATPGDATQKSEQTGLLAGITPQPSKNDKVAATPAADQPVVIPSDHIKNAKQSFLAKPKTIAVLGKDSKNIMDPALTALTEDKLAPFWKLLDLPTVESTYHFSSSVFAEMGAGSLPLLATAAFNYKNLCIAKDQEIFRLKQKMEKNGIADVKDVVNTSQGGTAMTDKNISPEKKQTWAEKRAAGAGKAA